jgi:hypothetical protein
MSDAWMGPQPPSPGTLTATPVGVGGGGTMYGPQISPTDPNTMVVACDRARLF